MVKQMFHQIFSLVIFLVEAHRAAPLDLPRVQEVRLDLLRVQEVRPALPRVRGVLQDQDIVLT